jgi:hypothetical protein
LLTDDQFDAYIRKRYGVGIEQCCGSVLGEDLRDCWRTAREAAIEECAQLCERRAQKVASVTRHSEGHVLAAAIRALREGK